MSSRLISEVIVPVLSAAIGAGIGGWIAFLIAKHKFSLENRDEGRAGLNTMSFWLSEICEKCSHMQNVPETGHQCHNFRPAGDTISGQLKS